MRHGSVRRAFLGAVAAAMVALGLLAVPASAGHALDVPLVHDGALRQYRLYVPGSLPLGRPVPLVIAMHGLGGEAKPFAAATKFDQVADKHGFVVAYPQGLWKSWNAGTCCGDASAVGVDDVGFLARLVSDVALTLPVDRTRVYATGFSNGGMMALRAACERPDVFAAVANVSGTLVAPCTPAQPVSVLQVVGARDRLVPYRGQAWSQVLRTPLTALPVGSGTWERTNACSGLPARTRTSKAEVRTYDRCAAGTAVRLVLLPKVAHTWPSAARDGWNAPDEIWRFFASRSLAAGPRPAPVLATRVVAARTGDRVEGLLDGRFDVVIGRRVAVDVRRGKAWVAVGSATTDVEGRFRFLAPRGGALRIRYAGAPGLPSFAVVA